MYWRRLIYVYCLTIAAGADGLETVFVQVLAATENDALVALPEFAQEVRVVVGDQDLPLSEAIERATTNQDLAEYRRLRVEQGGSPAGQLALARWCKQHGMSDEEQLHWRILLFMEPGHPAAMKGLRVREYHGRLLTAEEIVQVKQEEKKLEQLMKKWGPRLKQLRRAMKRGGAEEKAAAVEELKSIDDPKAMPAVEEVFSGEDLEIVLHVVEMLEGMPGREAAGFLVREAVLSEHDEVRAAAAYGLKYRPHSEYTPPLVAGLEAPLELQSDVSVEEGGTVLQSYQGRALKGSLTPLGGNRYAYSESLRPALHNKVRLDGNYTSQDVAVWGLQSREVSGVTMHSLPDLLRYRYQLIRESQDPDAPLQFTGEIAGTDKSVHGSIDNFEAKIAALNAATARRNQRILETLTKATGIVPKANRRAVSEQDERDLQRRFWWSWWRKQTNTNNFVAQGMEVWTSTGLRPIEDVLLGDRLLTRDEKSGELSFRMVVGVDVQPQEAMTQLVVNSRTIVTTPEQPLLAHGEDWWPASELDTDIELIGLGGPLRIAEISPGAAMATYNLQVAGGTNYFVDRLGIQIGDGTGNGAVR